MDPSLLNLYQKRRKQWAKEIGRYSRLILNDHFSIVLFVVLGFGIFFYQDQLVKLQVALQTPGVKYGLKGLLSVLVTSLLLLGRPLWFTKTADQSFLFARGQAWQPYWLKGTYLTTFLWSVVIAVGLIVLAPLMQLVNQWTLGEMGLFGLWVLLAKTAYELLRYLLIYYSNQRTLGLTGFCLLQLVLAYLSMNLSFRGLVGFIGLYLMVVLLVLMQLKKGTQHRVVNFNGVIESEEKRQAHFYRFISVFADTPQQQTSIKPRPWLAPLLERMTYFNQSSLAYLYLRVLMRSTSYSSVWLRLLLFTGGLMFLTNNAWLLIVLGVLCLILTALQLMPLMHAYRHHPGVALISSQTNKSLKAFQLVLMFALWAQRVVFMIIFIYKVPFGWPFILALASWIGTSLLLAYGYAPYWSKKHH
ncbi:ABC transporter permease [Dolosicoccus paucivorans]|uniref:ABC transporter permease n=1 Tax=Dolosicoccus paucivorans TaxID=84521 RepID=UPI00088F9E8C|nr:ABC transporter permease [Dolosicoccus paucivorans]SDI68856.1 Predicted ABC-type exoprotein transport system, permease component [Dolosicoccus paucivorans]